MLEPAFREIAIGWVLGQAVGTLIARRADRRGLRVDRERVVETWSVVGACFGALFAFIRMI